MSKHWTERMFVEEPSLFGAILEKAIDRAGSEVAGLEKIFSRFGVSKNGLILDLCCGIGRHSVMLAEKGYRVVGADISPKFIARAKEMAIERHVSEKVDLRVSDMRQIGNLLAGYERKFDAVLNLYTSIGYYDEETDRDVLAQVLGLTAAEGILIIETKNRDHLVRYFRHRDIDYVSDDLVLIEERRLNLENSRMESVWKYYRKQEDEMTFIDRFEVDHRVYSPHELKRLVEASGWKYETCYGGFLMESLTMNSSRMILVARKM